MILTELHIEAHLSPEEIQFLDAERTRMDKEEPISLPWLRESVLEAWLQIAIDHRRGVDEDPKLRKAKQMIKTLAGTLEDASNEIDEMMDDLIEYPSKSHYQRLLTRVKAAVQEAKEAYGC